MNRIDGWNIEKLILSKPVRRNEPGAYIDKPILCSPGDFITGGTDSSGEIKGIDFSKDSVQQYIFRIDVKGGYPELKKQFEKLNYLAGMKQ